jgi:adenylate cyclase, class 2
MDEIEAKILEIDVETVKHRIAQLGGKLCFSGEMVAHYYDHPILKTREQGLTFRLRKEANHTLLAIKSAKRDVQNVKVAEEIQTRIEDADTIKKILERLGFFTYQTIYKHRDEYELEKTHIAIDTMHNEDSLIPPFLEIEAHSVAEVHRIAELLGFSAADCKPWGGKELRQHYKKA